MQFVAFDLETTGIMAGVDRIVEIGAVRFSHGKITSVYSTLVDPQIPIPPEASRVNGITNEMVSGKPKIEQLLNSFAEFCGADPMVAHNAPFDTGFLIADINRYGTLAPRGLILDTLPMARKVFPGLLNYKLGTLVKHLEVAGADFHRAEQDASYCGQVFLKIVNKIFHQSQPVILEQLIALAGKGEQRFPQPAPVSTQEQLILL
jgi:DNA polymerase-3 subunit epsilon